MLLGKQLMVFCYDAFVMELRQWIDVLVTSILNGTHYILNKYVWKGQLQPLLDSENSCVSVLHWRVTTEVHPCIFENETMSMITYWNLRCLEDTILSSFCLKSVQCWINLMIVLNVNIYFQCLLLKHLNFILKLLYPKLCWGLHCTLINYVPLLILISWLFLGKVY